MTIETTLAGRDAVLEDLRSASKLIVVTHENPDGDALGSLIATQQLLTALGKDADVVVVFDLHGRGDASGDCRGVAEK